MVLFFNKDREISGICSLADTAFFQGFLTTLDPPLPIEVLI